MSLFNELNRRNVFRMAIAYAVLAWVMAQVAELLFDAFGAPDWALKSLLALFLVGFPFVIFFSWVYELTPDGVKRENEVDRTHSVTRQTGRKLDRLIIGVLLIALAAFAWDRFYNREEGQNSTLPATTAAKQDPTDQNEKSDSLPVIAVLPFKASGSDDGGFLASGLHDDLLTRLAKLGAFKVISRTSMMEYASTSKNMRKIGEELGAGFILEGGVQAIGQQVRVNAQLIDAEADLHIWADVYDRDLTAANLFDIQSELAIAIARELKTELSAADMELVGEVPTNNIEAYQAYLSGLQLTDSLGYIGTQRNRESVEAFKQATSLDPGFAIAWAELASSLIRASCCRFGPDQAAAVLKALSRARALKPGMLESELAWAEYLYRFENEYQQALDALAPFEDEVQHNYQALLLSAFMLRRLGRYQEAYSKLLIARALAPRNSSVYIHLTDYAQQNDDCAAAAQHADTLRNLGSDEPGIRVSLAEYELECTGNAERATELIRDLDFSGIGGFESALWAATLARDADRVLSLVLSPIPENATADIPVRQQLFLAHHYRYLAPDEEQFNNAMELAELRLANITDEQSVNDETYAYLKMMISALQGDAVETQKWVDEHKQRFRKSFKGDLSMEAENHLEYAIAFAEAGLANEAIAELHAVLVKPGGHHFAYFDGAPVFDSLREHPGYVALRKQYVH